MNILTNTSTGRGVGKNMSGGKVLTPKSAIFVTFYPKLCKFLQFSPKFAQILTLFPKICANFDIFSKKLCKFWQFLPKILQILAIFTKKRGETFSKNFRMRGKNKILWQNIHLCSIFLWVGSIHTSSLRLHINNIISIFRHLLALFTLPPSLSVQWVELGERTFFSSVKAWTMKSVTFLGSVEASKLRFVTFLG